MRACGCAGFRGLGAVDETTGIDAAALAQMVFTDSYGRRFWKPEVEQLIIQSLPGLWVANEYMQAMPLNMSAPLARLTAEKPDSAPPSYPSGTEPFTADTWVTRAIAGKAVVAASYGMAIPSSALEKMLIAVPGSEAELVRAASWMAPLMNATWSVEYPTPGIAPAPGGGVTPSPGIWEGLGTTGKVVVIGGGVLVVAGALGLLSHKRRRRPVPE